MGLLISSKKLSHQNDITSHNHCIYISNFKKRSSAKQCSQLSFLNTGVLISIAISPVMITQSFLRFYQIFEHKILFKRQLNILTLIFQFCVIFLILITICITLLFFLFLNGNACSLLYEMSGIFILISCLHIYFTLNHTSTHKL